ncbi:hypothetical protein VE03_01208 [Pseudogymnoascus sp. 23342-1-I1]|nr:hypothetical protein VE03_01208 [Pseudogymnoascus sp. 23342-1-I1]
MSATVPETPVAAAQNQIEEKVAALDISQAQTTSAAASLRVKPEGPVKTPFVDPAPSAKPKEAVALTADQEAKYEEVLATVKTWTEIPSTKGKEGPIVEEEIMWLTRDCILRYLRATKWQPAEAAKRLLGTLTWRREFGLLELTPEHISPENETGKQIILGFDEQARPCLYLNPGRQNTESSHRQVEHLAYMLERVIDMMIPGQESICLLINFKSSKSRSNTSPQFAIAREVLNILQTHYPERLGRAALINIPFVVNMFLKLIMPFVDPLTREKLHFNEDLTKFVPKEQLWTDVGGAVEFEYDHETYWPALNSLCRERAAERKVRWEAAGKHYGESELHLKGGDVPSLGKKVEPEAVVEAEAPVVPVAEAPVAPVVEAPVAPVVEAPVAPEADIEAKTAVASEADIKTETPVAPAAGIENQKPEAKETQA